MLIFKFFCSKTASTNIKTLMTPPLLSLHGQRAMSLHTEGLLLPRPLHSKLGSSQPQTNECLVLEQSDSPVCHIYNLCIG